MLLALFAGVFRYADQHFYDAETFLDDTSELAVNADIRDHLLDGFRSDIIAMAEGEEEAENGGLADLLDDDDPLNTSDPITEADIARDEAIEKILLESFFGEQYSRTFESALVTTQQQLVRSAELESVELLRDKGEIFFDMRGLNATIYERLASEPATAEITQNDLPADFGVFKVADRDTTMNWLWTLLRNAPNWRATTMMGAILAFIGAVVVAERRPSTAIQFGGGMVGVGVVLVVVIYLIRFLVPLLAGGGSSANPVVAVYASNTWPLVTTMIRLVILGAVIAAAGGIAKLIWPDDWVYSSVSDDRGVRSIKRRRGAPEPEQAQPQQQPAAAMVPAGYVGYAQPYPGYPQQWGQGYAPYPPGYPAPYPAGPYAQPGQPMPQHYNGPGPGKPTVPVMPVNVDQAAGELVPPAAPPLDDAPGDLPDDAAQAVPRVVAAVDDAIDADSVTGEVSAARATVVDTGAEGGSAGDADDDVALSSQELLDEAEDALDEWASEKDW